MAPASAELSGWWEGQARNTSKRELRSAMSTAKEVPWGGMTEHEPGSRGGPIRGQTLKLKPANAQAEGAKHVPRAQAAKSSSVWPEGSE